MNKAVNPTQIMNTNSFASQDTKPMALSVRNSLENLPPQVRERQRHMHEARNRGDTKTLNQLASNLALANNPKPPQTHPLIRHHNAKEVVET